MAQDFVLTPNVAMRLNNTTTVDPTKVTRPHSKNLAVLSSQHHLETAVCSLVTTSICLPPMPGLLQPGHLPTLRAPELSHRHRNSVHNVLCSFKSFTFKPFAATSSSITCSCGTCLLLPCMRCSSHWMLESDVVLNFVSDASLRLDCVVPLHMLSVRFPLIERNVERFKCSLDSVLSWVLWFFQPREPQLKIKCRACPLSAP